MNTQLPRPPGMHPQAIKARTLLDAQESILDNNLLPVDAGRSSRVMNMTAHRHRPSRTGRFLNEFVCFDADGVPALLLLRFVDDQATVELFFSSVNIAAPALIVR